MQAIGTNSRILADVNTPALENSAGFIAGSQELEADHSNQVSHRLVPLLAWMCAILTLVFIPLKIVSYGYLPGDDALRHAAKAVSGRDWSDILVLQDQFKMDHNPGWHWILTQVHQETGWQTDALVTMSVIGLVLLFSFVPLGWIRRPEAWVAALLLAMVAFPGMMLRMFLGRPFVLSMGATLAIMMLWQNRKAFPPALLAGTTALFALGAWVHGSWYLFALVVGAFAFVGEWPAAKRLLACWLGGSLLAATLTGHPLGFLWNALNIGFNCFSQHQLQRMLVSEFRPSEGDPVALICIAALLGARFATGTWNWKCVKNPIFMLMVLSWILGLRVVRFWADWGQPALALWAALELQEHFKRYIGGESVRRLALTAGLCLALFFAVTADASSRWTSNLTIEPLNEADAEMDPWLPEDGGILYAADMQVFYLTFFKNPHAKWKYILGFESTFMPPEDLKIYRHIQWNYYAHKAYEGWVAKMRPQDRLVIRSSSTTAPAIPELEWKTVARETWVGRLPRPEVPAPDGK